MERYPNSQIVLKSINVNKQLQQINFQIRHPENAIRIIGIMVTCNLYFEKRFRSQGKQVGVIAFSNADKGDAFYSQAVELDRNIYRENIEIKTFPTIIKPSFSKTGKRFTWFKTSIPIKSAIIEGYYSDTLSKKYIDFNGEVLPFISYGVNIYLQYEIKQQ